jgi:signal recognition particle subunit SRP54
MLEALSSKLRGALQKIAKLGAVDREAVEALVEEIRRAMISADVDVKLAAELAEKIKAKALQEKLPSGLTRREHVINVVYDELTKVLGGEKPEVSLKPKKVLLVGLFGSGKTSTAAKLARFYQKKGLRPALIACDTFRPAAYEQLEQLARKIDAPFFGIKGEKDASKIAKEAPKKLKADVLIFDSSGRDALDKELVKEIQALSLTITPQEKILVLPADIGQAARIQAEAFQKALGITDVIVTKMDATAKGGGALTACTITGAKIKFIAIGETPEDLEAYEPKRFVGRLLGMPDLQALLEKAQAAVKPEAAAKILTAEFSLDDFVQQMEGMKQMGPLSGVLDMLGLGGKVPKELLEQQQSKMEKWKHIMSSMTRQEKATPEIIDAPRIKRIALGSGTAEQEVRELLGNYNKVKKMMKGMGAGRLKRGDMSKMLRGFGGMKGLGL